ncbi:hypothetical protein RD110_02060 [Rhodoferax koreense]|uniref:Uncharacterized protein n=1 Tax=Rhodoferax koreensis TaxID=1842727 RepID=A0A1P8JQV4_9BURK|nr:PhaM family polyhydroxyalkanoate granule multifunctional regulatory protein [Rhodoferax koreense]APW36142.1 hypothetical protein RD110_02060 [Rhodoferax koreense]
MSDAPNFDFSKFVPGFDFLQNLAKGASQKMPQMPKLGNWVAPTINVEELDKRIDELKAVQFWLDQNATALKATIQALEVQKMTLATLRGMNFSMGDLADAFKIKTPAPAAEPSPAPAAPVQETAAATDDDAKAEDPPANAAGVAPGVVDPLQWWNSLTHQFQQIAASAIKDATAKTAVDGSTAANFAKEAFKSAEEFAKVATKPLTAAVAKPAAKAAAKKAPARKAASKTSAAAKKRTR